MSRKQNEKMTDLFVYMPVNCFKYLSLSWEMGWTGVGDKKKMKKKPYISVSSSAGFDAYRVFLVTFL